MIKSKISNLTKSDITKEIHKKIGLSVPYASELTNDIIIAIKHLINENEIIGRNPKTNEEYKILSQKSLSFICSKKFNNEINSF